MFKWLNKVRIWKKEGQEKASAPIIYEYGRYVHKPTVERALSRVIGVDSESYIINLTACNGGVYLNGKRVSLDNLKDRLESGDYEITLQSGSHVWRFFIL